MRNQYEECTSKNINNLLPLVDPDGERLNADVSGDLVSKDGGYRIKLLNNALRLYDGTLAEGDDAAKQEQGESERVRFAYRIYSTVYPIVALFLFWFVWRGSIRSLARYYGGHLAEAAAQGAPYLDVGVGDGSLTRLAMRSKGLRGYAPVLYVDLSFDMLKKAAKRFRKQEQAMFLVQDVLKLGVAPGTVPHIGCFGSIHVFPEPLAALERLASSLRSDGVLTGSILLSPETGWRNRMVERFLRTGALASSFTESEVDALFTQAGLEFEEKIINGHQLLFRARPISTQS